MGFGVGTKRPLSPRFVSPPAYGSAEWMRAHVQAGNRPVGVVKGLIINFVRFPGSRKRGCFCKVIGGSAEHPTVIGLTPDEIRNAVWTISRDGRAPGRLHASGLAIIGESPVAGGDQGTGMTPWVTGGILVGLAIAIKAAERKYA
jgi:hypothetical protein